MAGDGLGHTYRIEQELDVLRTLRMTTATQFCGAMMIYAAHKEKRSSWWRLLDVWLSVRSLQREYEAVCAAVEAMESHHMDAYILRDVKEYLAEPAIERLERHRDKADDDKNSDKLLKEILLELRAIRDKTAPPLPDILDIQKQRWEMNSHRAD